MSEKHNVVLYNTLDPINPLGVPSGTPALTALLYKVCDGDGEKFNEACRLICLFLDKKAELDGEPLKKLERLMGYVQNGTDGIISLFQDDATMGYNISRSKPSRDVSYYDWVTSDKSLGGAINKAYNEQIALAGVINKGYSEHGSDCE